ncbi:MAG: (2Fe-2S)-binding protein [Chloroflexi bacterium]|nr:(2Fe-2S)-binding protein [Chloroflexota bacterium]
MDDLAEQDIVCFCEWVTRDELIAAIPHVRDLKELRETTRACMTCFGCEGDLDEIVEQCGYLFGTASAGRP